MMHNSQMKTKILLIGGNGQVGHALKSSLQDLGELVVCTRAELDLGVVGRGADHVAHCPISALVSGSSPSTRGPSASVADSWRVKLHSG